MFILSHKKYGEFEDFDVSSESSPNTSYLVTIDHDEETCYCTCPDFRYSEHHCKHIKFALNLRETIQDVVTNETYKRVSSNS